MRFKVSPSQANKLTVASNIQIRVEIIIIIEPNERTQHEERAEKYFTRNIISQPALGQGDKCKRKHNDDNSDRNKAVIIDAYMHEARRRTRKTS